VARRTTHKVFALAPVLAVALLGAACGAGGTGAPPAGGGGNQPSATGGSEIPTVSKDDKLAAMVPDEYKADGKLVWGQDQSYPPNEFVEGTTAVGMDVDLGKAIGQKLGLDVQFENAAFSGIIAGLAANKYEGAMSSFTLNEERLQQVDMVSYFSAGSSLATLKGNPDKLSLDDLCGKNIAVQQGTVQVDDLTARSEKCKTSGKTEITLQQFQNQTDVNLALTSKRTQGMLADSPVVDYAIKQTNGQLEQVGQVYDTAPYGLALPKGKGQYGQAVQGAVQALIDDGTYKKILAKWGVDKGGVTKAELNPKPAS
jgi:polar amino acid transport system substrate-binding protein